MRSPGKGGGGRRRALDSGVHRKVSGDDGVLLSPLQVPALRKLFHGLRDGLKTARQRGSCGHLQLDTTDETPMQASPRRKTIIW